jgi:hypothetical protein
MKLVMQISQKYFIFKLITMKGARGGIVVEALRYKPEGRWFDSRWFHWSFPFT